MGGFFSIVPLHRSPMINGSVLWRRTIFVFFYCRELSQVKEHDREVTAQVTTTQDEVWCVRLESTPIASWDFWCKILYRTQNRNFRVTQTLVAFQLKAALRDAQKNSSLLAEYHDLYELQRKRLEKQVSVLSDEKELWSSTAYALALKVNDISPLSFLPGGASSKLERPSRVTSVSSSLFSVFCQGILHSLPLSCLLPLYCFVCISGPQNAFFLCVYEPRGNCSDWACACF